MVSLLLQGRGFVLRPFFSTFSDGTDDRREWRRCARCSPNDLPKQGCKTGAGMLHAQPAFAHEPAAKEKMGRVAQR